jgi:hypothetical protein
MLQNVAAQNVRVPTSHNIKRHKTYTITKSKVHTTQELQNAFMFCDAVRYVTITF